MMKKVVHISASKVLCRQRFSVLYDFYPQAYTPESKNVRWSIRKLTSDSLVVYMHKPTVVLDGDTLYTVGDAFETFTRKSGTI